MSLYQLADAYETLYEQIDAVDPLEENGEALLQGIMDTLEGIEGELNEKAEHVALFVKSLEYDAAAIRAEEWRLQERRKAKEQKISRLKTYLQEQLLRVGKKKLETPRAVIRIRQNAEAVHIDDEQALLAFGTANHADYLTPQPPKLDKQKLKKAMQAGLCVTGAHLERSTSLQIQ